MCVCEISLLLIKFRIFSRGREATVFPLGETPIIDPISASVRNVASLPMSSERILLERGASFAVVVVLVSPFGYSLSWRRIALIQSARFRARQEFHHVLSGARVLPTESPRVSLLLVHPRERASARGLSPSPRGRGIC